MPESPIANFSGKDRGGQPGRLIRSANGIAALPWANVPLDSWRTIH